MGKQSLQVVIGATAEPLSLAEAKQHLRATAITAEDALVQGLVATARQAAETATQRQIVAARLKLTLDGFPGAHGGTFGDLAIVIPKAPVLQVTLVEYFGLDAAWHTMTEGQSGDYVVDLNEPCRITPPFGKVWPVDVMPSPQTGTVRVTFIAGMTAKVTANASANTVYTPGWKTLAVGDTCRFWNRDQSNVGDGALPSNIAAQTDYYVQNVAGTDLYKLSTSNGGAAIVISNVGTGETFITESRADELSGLKAWMKVAIVGTFYENRERFTAEFRLDSIEVPSSYIDGLLDPYRLMLY